MPNQQRSHPVVFDVIGERLEALLRLLKDGEVRGHAVMALGKLAYIPARDELIPFLDHEKAWIRRKAKQAIAAIDKKIMRNRQEPKKPSKAR